MPSTAVLERKKQMVADLSERIKNSCAGVVVDYKTTQSFVRSFVKQVLNTQ